MAYLPSRLEGIKVGDTVRFMSSGSMEKNSNLRCGWNMEMNYLCGQTRTITEEIMGKITREEDDIWIERSSDGENIWYISIDMIDFIRESPEDEKQLPAPTLLLSKETKDPNIIKEMISKVDKTRFKKLLAIGCRGNIKMDTITNETVDKYLDIWANGKYEFYLLFGNKLAIEKKIDVEMNDREMREKIDELCFDFPKYCSTINMFNYNNFMRNVCGENGTFEKYVKGYNPTEKLTGFLSSLYKDKKFDDAIATMISNRYVKAILAISIDPYDYLTMSLNNHEWTSCQEIGRGEYATGAASILLDDTTVMSYKYNGKQVPLTRRNYKFEGNDKSWRQCIYLDKNTSGAIFGRQYPSDSTEISKEVRDFLESVLSEYLGIENTWKVSGNCQVGYVDHSSCLYHDILHGYRGKAISHKNKPSDIQAKFLVGRDVPCVVCGKEIKSTGSSFLCSKHT